MLAPPRCRQVALWRTAGFGYLREVKGDRTQAALTIVGCGAAPASMMYARCVPACSQAAAASRAAGSLKSSGVSANLRQVASTSVRFPPMLCAGRIGESPGPGKPAGVSDVSPLRPRKRRSKAVSSQTFLSPSHVVRIAARSRSSGEAKCMAEKQDRLSEACRNALMAGRSASGQ